VLTREEDEALEDTTSHQPCDHLNAYSDHFAGRGESGDEKSLLANGTTFEVLDEDNGVVRETQRVVSAPNLNASSRT